MLDRLTAKGRRIAQASARRGALLRAVYDQNRSLADTPPGPERKRNPRGRRLILLFALSLLIAATLVSLPALPPGATTGAALQPADSPPGDAATGTIRAATPASPLLRHAPRPAGLEPIALADIASLPPDDANLKALFGLSVQTIVIDAGHGGRDPGAVGALGTLEKDITLDVARRLRDKLAASGAYRIVLVRDADVFVPLRERAAFANQHGADLFVSIHVNYLPRVSTNAVETYYFGRFQDERTRQLAELENQGSDYSLSEFESLVRNMQDTLKLQESRTLAHAIQDTLLASIRARNQRVLDNGVRTAPFVVLLGVKAPSVLVEIGSLSSPEAERSLRREAYRDEIAAYLAAGLVDYLNQQRPQEYRSHEDQDQLAQRH